MQLQSYKAEFLLLQVTEFWDEAFKNSCILSEDCFELLSSTSTNITKDIKGLYSMQYMFLIVHYVCEMSVLLGDEKKFLIL